VLPAGQPVLSGEFPPKPGRPPARRQSAVSAMPMQYNVQQNSAPACTAMAGKPAGPPFPLSFILLTQFNKAPFDQLRNTDRKIK